MQTLAPATGGRGGSWNRDGVILFAPDTGTGLSRVSVDGGLRLDASGAWIPLHFGLGGATTATVEVIPPGATAPAVRFENVAAGRLYTLRDGVLIERRAFRR